MLNLIDKHLSDASVQICDSREALYRRLRLPGFDIDVYLLLIDTLDDLKAISRFKELLVNEPIVLILPDMECQTMSSAFRLYPRFIYDINSEFSEFSTVVQQVSRKAVYPSKWIHQSRGISIGDDGDILSEGYRDRQ